MKLCLGSSNDFGDLLVLYSHFADEETETSNAEKAMRPRRISKAREGI